jgi:hypothetical protein
LGRKSAQPKGQANHAAPGPYLGFGLQPVRLVFNLLAAPTGSIAFIEFDDDVSVHYNDGARLLEQTKSALNSEPSTDRATDLWKAFANWARYMAAENAPTGDVTFRYYVTPVHSGNLVIRMHHAWDSASVSNVLSEVYALMTNDIDPPAWQKHLRVFCGAPSVVQEFIVANFEFQTDDDPLTPIQRGLAPLVKSEVSDMICKLILGHGKATTDNLMRRRKPGAIATDDFHRYSQEAISRVSVAGLVSLGQPGDAAVAQTLAAAPNFLKQLDLIAAENPDKIESVTHYLQSEADKIFWADAGKLLPGDLERWDADLESSQRHLQKEVSLENPLMPPEHIGMLVYVKCRKLPGVIRAQHAPLSFVHGSLHNLADQLLIGWHPAYKSFI